MTRLRYFCFGLLALAACDLGGADPKPGPTAPPRQVAYSLEWKRNENVRQLDRGWEVVNDLGYRVRVTRGWVVSRSMELIPCEPLPPSPLAALLEGLGELLRPGVVLAGHSAIADPSAITTGVVESVIDSGPRAAGSRTPGATEYCRVHYLIARAETVAVGLPPELDMVDKTLFLEGVYRRPGATADEPFAIGTAIANGKIVELPKRFHGGRASASVIIRRDLGRMFDRVDFAAMEEKRRAREILRNLVDLAEIEVRVSANG